MTGFEFGAAVLKLGTPIAKALLTKYYGAPAGAISGSILDVAAQRIKGAADQRRAERAFVDLSDQIITKLLPIFGEQSPISSEAVAAEIANTISQQHAVSILIQNDLLPDKIVQELRLAYPNATKALSEAEEALYHRALDELIRYLVATADALPQFQPKNVAAVLGRLTKISTDIEKILDRVAKIESFVHSGSSIDQEAAKHTRYEADYRQSIIRNLDFLELFGADISPEAQRHSLSVGYVSLNVTSTQGKGSRASGNSIFALLADSRGRLLLRGHAGSGKSTFLRWMAIAAASYQIPKTPLRHTTLMFQAILALDHPDRSSVAPELLELLSSFPNPNSLSEQLKGDFIKESKTRSQINLELNKWMTEHSLQSGELSDKLHKTLFGRDRIPFLIRLRECRTGTLPSPEAFPEFIASEIGRPPVNWVRDFLHDGRAIVLLDGVDEVPNSQRANMRGAIEAIVHQYPKAWFVVTTRPTAVSDNWLARADFIEATVSPMNDADQADFIQRWHEAVSQELERQSRPALPITLADDLIAKLSESPSMSRLATNPLLCAVLCALHRDRNQNLPENQIELCEAMCYLLLHRREVEAGLPISDFPEPYRLLGYPQKRALVLEIAYYMVRNEVSALNDRDIVPIVQKTLRTFPNLGDLDPRQTLNLLVERSGILREQTSGIIDFVHNTLKEYLAAEAFYSNQDFPLLARRAVDDAWRQVVLFSVARADVSSATKIVRGILEHADLAGQPTSAARQFRLAAVFCRTAAVRLDEDLIGQLKQAERRLIPPSSFGDAEVLAASGDHVAPMLRSKRMTARQAAASVRALRLIKTKLSLKILESYLDDERHVVILELAQAINPLHIRNVREALLHGSMVHPEISRYITDLTPLRDALRESGSKYLWLFQVGNVDLAPLAGLENLEGLGVVASGITSLAGLSNMPALEIFRGGISPVSELGPLTGLPLLRELDLEGCPITDVSNIRNLPSIRTLNMSRTQVARIDVLQYCENLEVLQAANCTKLELMHFPQLNSLRSLSVGGGIIIPACLPQKVPNLQKLDMNYSGVQDLNFLSRLSQIRSLLGLDVKQGTAKLLETVVDLAEVTIRGLTDAEVALFSAHKAISRLSIVDSFLENLEFISGNDKIRQLSILGGSLKSLQGIDRLTNLKSVLMICDGVERWDLLKHLPNLEMVTVKSIDEASMGWLLNVQCLKSFTSYKPVSREMRLRLQRKGVQVASYGVIKK